MFLGTHTPKVDEKGRIILPAKFRPGLSDGVVLTKGQDRSLVLWPIAEFEAAAAKVREASQSNAGVRAYSRCSSPAPSTRSRTSRAGSRCPIVARLRRSAARVCRGG